MICVTLHSNATGLSATRGTLTELAGRGRETRDLELIDIAGDMGRGRVHLLRQVHGGEIPDELAGVLDIARAVLPVGARRSR